jgi:hypothetical protein
MAEQYTIVRPDGARSTATRIITFHQVASTRAIRAPLSSTAPLPGKKLEEVENGVIIHSYPQYTDEAAFLAWLANIKSTAPPLPVPTRTRFKYANGIAEGKEAERMKAVEVRFATASDATAVVDYLQTNPIVACSCSVDCGTTACPDGEDMKIDCHFACKPNQAPKDMQLQAKWTVIMRGIDDSQKPKKWRYHVADAAYQEDVDEEGGICEWYVDGIGWFTGDCKENHEGFDHGDLR